MNKQIGKISKNVIKALKLDIEENTPIFISDRNIEHMKNNHPEDYSKYSKQISNILNNPTYVAKHPNKDSIEYIKRYILDDEYVLIAVRVTSNNVNFVRTMFVMTEKKVETYKNGGYFIEVNNNFDLTS